VANFSEEIHRNDDDDQHGGESKNDQAMKWELVDKNLKGRKILTTLKVLITLNEWNKVCCPFRGILPSEFEQGIHFFLTMPSPKRREIDIVPGLIQTKPVTCPIWWPCGNQR
jgi:hypothetical protein